jgi:hypothetical protein
MLVQGTGFNWPHPDHFRIVFLPHEDDLREAIGRVAKIPGAVPQASRQPENASLILIAARAFEIKALGDDIFYKKIPMKPIQVGLLGIGTVGSGTFNVLQRNQEEIRRRAGRGIEITMVADLDVERARPWWVRASGGERRTRRHRQPRHRHRDRADRRLRHRQGAGAGSHCRRQARGHRQQGAAGRAWHRDLRRRAPRA